MSLDPEIDVQVADAVPFEINPHPVDVSRVLSREQRLGRIHEEMAKRPGMMIPDMVLGRVVDDLPAWTLRAEYGAHGQTRVLTRPLLRPDIVEVPEDDDRRKFTRGRDKLEIELTRVIGEDVLFMLDLDEKATNEESKPFVPANSNVAEIDPEEDVDDGITDSLFTLDQRRVLRLSTSYVYNHDIGGEIDKSSYVVAKIFTAARYKLGVDTDEEVILYAIAEGIAPIDHIPEGRTEGLKPEQREFLEAFYSTDPDIRRVARTTNLRRMGLTWNRIYIGLGMNRLRTGEKKRAAFLHAVRDGVIKIPNLSGNQEPPATQL